MKSGLFALIVATVCLLSAGLSGSALAADVTISSPTPFSSIAVGGTFTVTGNLTITSTGSITCDDPVSPTAADACDINIVVTGNMIMQAGSEITAENNHGSGNGGNITITVGGDMTLCGPAGAATGCGGASANPGALISSSQTGGGTGSHAGNITITVGNFPNTPPVGIFTMEPGTQILADSAAHSAGAIAITAGKQMDIDGLVESKSGQTGAGALRPPGGGPITLKSGCLLNVSDAGKISSEGRDPGADLVHLEACDVVINGIVQSIANNAGHGAPNNPPNHCNLDPVAHPLGAAQNFTACVEVWATDNITINSIAPHNGEVSADGIRAPNRSWIDLFAGNNITINNDTTGPYSVHANANSAATPSQNRLGGLITVKAENGKDTFSGLAIQANASGNNSIGGDVIVQAGGSGSPAGDVDLGNSSIQAEASGSGSDGGTISARSFNGKVLGSGELNASGTATNGTVTLQACLGVTFTGTSTPAATILANVCGGVPTLPANVLASFAQHTPICQACGGTATKSGRKFDSATNQGIDGITIHLFGLDTSNNPVHLHTVTAGGGLYSFTVAPGTYNVCEEFNPANFAQTFPVAGTQNPANACSTHPVVTAGDTMGAQGYGITLAANDNDTGNDFGNTVLQTPNCPEDPKAVCTRSVTTGGSLQAAFNAAAANANETICVFANTTENVILGDAKTLTITQCTVAKVTAADNTKPVIDITSTGKLTIIGLDTSGGTVGWDVDGGGGHILKSIRASGASQFGVLVESNSNTVSCNLLSGNAVGMNVTGNSNDIKSCKSNGNVGDGIQLSGNSNTLEGSTTNSNGGNGVTVSGSGNNLKANRSNTGASGSSTENAGFEYDLPGGAIDLGSNKADGITVPKTTNPQKCPTFPAAGTQCE